MPIIATFVFFDIETTGLPKLEYNQTKITELAFVACSRDDVMNHTTVPRVLHKLTKCVNPGKPIDPVASKMSGLSETILQKESIFSKKTADLIKTFFEELQAPVCLVAHSGNSFDYPIFRKELDAVGVSMDDLFCVDSRFIFEDIAKNSKFVLTIDSTNNFTETPASQTETLAESLTETLAVNTNYFDVSLSSDIQKQPETIKSTPSTPLTSIVQKRPTSTTIDANRALIPNNGQGDGPMRSSKPISFKLVDIYAWLYMNKPPVAHHAEDDAFTLLKCVLALKNEFVERAEKKAKKFMDIKPLGKKIFFC